MKVPKSEASRPKRCLGHCFVRTRQSEPLWNHAPSAPLSRKPNDPQHWIGARSSDAHPVFREFASLGFPMLRKINYVLAKLDWMRAQSIWPHGLRYLWTDAFGVVLLVSLYRELGEQRWLDQAEQLVAAASKAK
jgi:hypothetical protein